jgi:hypothetical protein
MSEKSIVQKMMVKAGHKILFLNAPKSFVKSIGELPAGAQVIASPVEAADVAIVFVQSRKELESQLGILKKKVKPAVILWVAYPKGTSGVKTDINRDTIREYASDIGFQAVAMFAIDETWAALRLKVK